MIALPTIQFLMVAALLGISPFFFREKLGRKRNEKLAIYGRGEVGGYLFSKCAGPLVVRVH